MNASYKINKFKYGIKRGLPICFGYIPVAFTFGMMAVGLGIDPLMAVIISLSNLTSAGQFAGIGIIAADGSYTELLLATVIINMRYMLMSLSLSQKLVNGTGLVSRLVFGFGITDEVFAIASTEQNPVSGPFMYGLILTPILGWTSGTALGAFISGILPEQLAGAMGIALYAMFIAIIVPPAKKSMPIVTAIVIAVVFTCIMQYIPLFSFITSGFRLIIATIISATFTALIYPIGEEQEAADARAVEEGKQEDSDAQIEEDRKQETAGSLADDVGHHDGKQVGQI